MHRRTVVKALISAGASVALGACTAQRAPSAATRPAATQPAATRPPVARTPSVLPSRTAPAESLTVATLRLSLSRGADRPLPTTVWYPRAAGAYPLILFSHGLGGIPRNYADLLTSWARAGFVVAAPAYPHTAAGVRDFNVLDVLNQPADATEVITQALSRLEDRVDPQRIAAAGHSAGAITTLGMFSGNRDGRLRAGVVLAGRQIVTSPFTGAAAPMLFVHGRRDPTVAYADGRAAYDTVEWPKAFLSITDGGHLPTGGELDVVAATSTDFWRWSLYGDGSAKSRIKKDATRGGLATLSDDL
jgi:fermentation-respiration switch protein FrsA (DUF1100 family)